MKKESIEKKVHPRGEEEYEFPVGGGVVRMKASQEVLTPYGGIVPWSAFLKKTQFVERLVATCPIKRKSPNATSVSDILQSFFLAVVCDGRRFSHINRMREDEAAGQVLGIKRMCGDDTVKRFFGSMSEVAAGEWVAKSSQAMWRSLPDKVILDWDSTVQTKYGKQEGAAVGYNPQKQGRRSFHPLLAIAAGTRLCPYYRFRQGDTVTASQWDEAARECKSALGTRANVWLHRGDKGLGTEKVISWHEKTPNAPCYLFKLKLTSNIKRAMAALKEEDWQGVHGKGILQVSEVEIQLQGWRKPRRVVLARKLQGTIPAASSGAFWDYNKYEMEAYVTSLPQCEVQTWQVVELYRQRGDAENVFDELKNQWGFNGFTSKKRRVSSLAQKLLLLAYNAWNLFSRLMCPHRHIEAAGGRRWFLLMAARLTISGRQKTIQISVKGKWWQLLQEGYKRLLLWLELTAPQLDSQNDNLSNDSIFFPQIPAPNCAF